MHYLLCDLTLVTVIVNVGQLTTLINNRLQCTNCVGHVCVSDIITRGLCSKLKLTCSNCEVIEIWDPDESQLYFPDSSTARGSSAITSRMVFAMISAGLGLAACNTILRTLNIKVSLLFSLQRHLLI